MLLSEFPVTELRFTLPDWLGMLPEGHWLPKQVEHEIREIADSITKVGDIRRTISAVTGTENGSWSISELQHGTGRATLALQLPASLYASVVEELTGFAIKNQAELLQLLRELAETKRAYKKVESAVVGGYTKIEDKFVNKHLTRDGETVEEAKERLKKRDE